MTDKTLIRLSRELDQATVEYYQIMLEASESNNAEDREHDLNAKRDQIQDLENRIAERETHCY